jgi:hypothetical protein
LVIFYPAFFALGLFALKMHLVPIFPQKAAQAIEQSLPPLGASLKLTFAL